ncbi:MAG: divergent polysaccharide deacetylase family protein [Acetobacteraceae bacterium]|nr:divergent polysaccharide deacetylase family protein [Acetobacteraceae bacterium]
MEHRDEPPRHPGWVWLRRFWGAVGVLLLTGIATLAWLGPPSPVAEDPAVSAAMPSQTASRPEAGRTEGPRADLPVAFAALADPALLEASRHGPLPRIGPDGRTPIRAYGRAFDRADPRPRVALVLGNLGMNAALSEQAIQRLPAEIGLAFSPYAQRPLPLVERARERGFEVLVALPLEPSGFPMNDPGEQALLTGLPWARNADRLDWSLSRVAGYVGAIGATGPMRGERFAAQTDFFLQMQEVLSRRGLLYLDARPGAPSPTRVWGRAVDVVVDDPPTRDSIERALILLERLARERGAALGYAGEAAPVTLERLASWAAGIEGRGVVLAPPSALIRRPEAAQR